MGEGPGEDMESPEGGDRRAAEEAEPVPKRNKRTTNPAVVLNSLERIHAIMAFWEGLSGLHRPVLPTPQLQQKKRAAVQDRWILAGLSAESLESHGQ